MNSKLNFLALTTAVIGKGENPADGAAPPKKLVLYCTVGRNEKRKIYIKLVKKTLQGPLHVP